MQRLERKIVIKPETIVSSVWAIPKDYDSRDRKAMILAHGAGNDMHNALISHVHERLAERGLMTVKFNFPYKEYGRNAPDRAPVLEETWHAVIAAVRNDPTLAPKSLFLAGKSMGGRIASQLVGQGEDCTGLVFLGYPLHPPNKRDNLRTAH